MAKKKSVPPRNESRTKVARSDEADGIVAVSHKIWVFPEWYIEVDQDGYVRSSVEGTLGAILRLMPRDPNSRNRLALKIPRLLADTTQENAYVCEITLGEMKNVGDAQDGKSDCLVTAQIIAPNATHKARALGVADDESARNQDGHVLFFQFNKRKNPRVCSVRVKERELSVFPPQVQEEIARFVGDGAWDDLANESRNTESRVAFADPVFVLTTAASDRIKRLQSEMSVGQLDKVWYAGLPGITFEWVGVTLQNALSENKFQTWKLGDYFGLLDRVMRGVSSLHAKRLLHCDLRPANIMGVGKDWTPEEFFVGDYGSFSLDRARFNGAPSGNTMMGPGVGNTRATPFYSLERRAGVERENVDTAIIIRDTEDPEAKKFKEYIVRLAWSRSFFLRDNGNGKLVYDETASVTPEIRTRIRQEAKELATGETEQTSSGDMAFLQNGDRLRVRDYVFEIVHAATTKEGGLVCRCESRFAHVLHDRLAVYDDDIEDEHHRIAAGIRDSSVLSLPFYTEFKQWSVATDLYGVGAISLYCLFVEGQRMENTDKSSENQVHIDRRLEILFAEMLGILESIPYFQSFWEDLERFTAGIVELEKKYPKGVPDKVTKINQNDSSSGDQDSASEGNEQHAFGELKAHALSAVNNIVQTAPHIRCLLYPFEFNAGAFLVFMHFVMGCIHRRSHLKSDSPPGTDDRSMPFCENRLDMPPQGDGGREGDKPVPPLAINVARDYLEERVADLIKKEWFRQAFRVDDPDENIGRFDPRNTFNIKRDIGELERQRKALEEDRENSEKESDKARKKIRELSAREKEKIASERRGLDDQRNELTSLRSKQDELVSAAENALKTPTGPLSSKARYVALEELAKLVIGMNAR